MPSASWPTGSRRPLCPVAMSLCRTKPSGNHRVLCSRLRRATMTPRTRMTSRKTALAASSGSSGTLGSGSSSGSPAVRKCGTSTTARGHSDKGAPVLPRFPASQAHPARPAEGTGSPSAPLLTVLLGSRPRSGRQGSSGCSLVTVGTAGCQSPASPLSCSDIGEGQAGPQGICTRLTPSPIPFPSTRLQRAMSIHYVTMAHLPPCGIQPHHTPKTSLAMATSIPQAMTSVGSVFMSTSLMHAVGTCPDLPYRACVSISRML